MQLEEEVTVKARLAEVFSQACHWIFSTIFPLQCCNNVQPNKVDSDNIEEIVIPRVGPRC